MDTAEAAAAPPARPARITFVAGFFILNGILASLNVLVGLAHGQANLNFGVLTLFVGLGLLRLKSSSRRWAIFWVCIGYFGFILTVIVLAMGAKPDITRIRFSTYPLRGLLDGFVPGLVLLLLVWTHCALTRPDTVAAFEAAESARR